MTQYQAKREFLGHCDYLGVIPPEIIKVDYIDGTWFFVFRNYTVSGDSPETVAQDWAYQEGLVSCSPDGFYKSVLMSLL